MSLLYKPILFKNIIICLVIITFFQASVSAQRAQHKQFTVVIDPGHGGRDPGTVWKKIYEKDIVLSIALKLGADINKYLPDVKVIYTRKTDIFIDLDKRAPVANKNQADLFISIHVNSAEKNNKPSGAETYLMGPTKLESNREVAEKENSVILYEEDYSTKYEGYDPKSSNSFILFSLLQNIHWKQSFSFADMVQKHFGDHASSSNMSVKQAGFLVLWKTTMPSVLIETGFITNEKDRKYLTSEKGQDAIALSIFNAFREYKQDIESRSVFAGGQQNSDSMTEPSADTFAKNDEAKDTLENDPVNDSVNDSENKPENKSGNKPETGSQIYFYVQIIASTKPIVPGSKFFKGLKNVQEMKVGNVYKYVVGKNSSFRGAVEHSREIKTYFPDAFIVAFRDGKIIPLKDALKEIKD